jgi:hypothetical protein
MTKTSEMTNPDLRDNDNANARGADSQPENPAVLAPIETLADPFDPMNLGISTDYAAAINARASSKPFELRKPNDQEFFRTSPREHQCVDVVAIADKQDMGRVYVVSGAIRDAVSHRFSKSVRATRLVLTVTLVGNALVWPVPQAEDRGGQWNSSQREASLAGLSKWTNMASGRGRYEVNTVDNPKTVDWDNFPPFREILRQACAERFIDSLDHGLLRKLAGNE